MKPVLTWVGGKQSLARDIVSYLQTETHSLYIEPFLGGGSVGLSLAKYCREHNVNMKLILSDLNPNLMNLYMQIRDNPEELMKELDRIGDADYHIMRDYYNKHTRLDVENAALFLWLNKHCFRGMYRTNKAGKFNTPRGITRTVYKPEHILAVSRELKNPNVELRICDYRDYHDTALYYLDPPYANTWDEYCLGSHNDSEALNRFAEGLPHGSTVYISNNEKYVPPESAELVLERQIRDGACHHYYKQKLEKLYKVNIV